MQIYTNLSPDSGVHLIPHMYHIIDLSEPHITTKEKNGLWKENEFRRIFTVIFLLFSAPAKITY